MGLAGKPAPGPFTSGVLQTRLRAKVLNNPQTLHRSCSRVGDARVSTLRTIAREPYRTTLTPHEPSDGVSSTKAFQKHANKHECISGTNQDGSAIPVRASAHSSNARRNKAHLTEHNIISGVRYMNYKESNMREGLAP
jgi:O-acetylhomoserine/O-acetylserine sulfhydrylase-like pyridoxal-dependent enzyme